MLVDNGSDEPEAIKYFSSLNSLPNITVMHDPLPFNYSSLNNRAACLAAGAILCLVNNDITVISPD